MMKKRTNPGITEWRKANAKFEMKHKKILYVDWCMQEILRTNKAEGRFVEIQWRNKRTECRVASRKEDSYEVI